MHEMSEERTIALGQYEAEKKRFQSLGLRYAALLKSLRDKINKMILKPDFRKGLDECEMLVKDLKSVQREANESLDVIESLQNTYDFD